MLLLTFVELPPAYQVAPEPVAVESRIDKKSHDTVPPPTFDRVAALPAEVELMVIKLPEVPDKLNALKYMVFAAVNVIVAGWVVLVMFPNVAPLATTVNAPAPPWLSAPQV